MKRFLILFPLLCACSTNPGPKVPAVCAGDVPNLIAQVGGIMLKEPDPKNPSEETKMLLAELGAKYGHDVVLCVVKALVSSNADKS
jgi:hypothetical protein